MINFVEDNHQYSSILPDGIEWISVSKLVGLFKEPFDAVTMSIKCSKKRDSKWYGMKPEEIRWIWKNKADRSCVNGTYYHNVQEKELLSYETIELYDKELPVIAPIFEEGVKIAPTQQLADGIYPEHMVYLKTVGVCGQSDKVVIANNILYVQDYKTNEKLETESYYNPYTGKHKMMLAPLNHIQDCNFLHYELQLSAYAYIILKHNPQLTVGDLEIEHVLFDTDGEDEWGDPKIKYSEKGTPIVKDIVNLPVRYLKTEVELMFAYLKENQHNLVDNR